MCQTKICKSCREVKCVNSFRTCNNTKDGYTSRCSICIKHNIYEILDAKEGAVTEAKELTAEILLEHFFVNVIFQKNFYIYDLKKGLALLQKFWQRLEYSRQGLVSPREDREITKATIMQIAFEHNHQRKEGNEDETD